MGLEFYYTVLLIACLVSWWVVERKRHQRNIQKIKYRIHINGTRGKSSVTRLIAGIFREAGIVTIAKTTGTLARVIFPDGHEEPLERRGGPNIKEQIKIISYAARSEAEAVVIECMALQPHYQFISENQMIQATVAVITNTRADHIDVMGPEPLDVVDALSGVIPKNGTLITSDRINHDRLEENAKKLGSNVVYADEKVVSDEELAKFSYIEHHDNVAVALKVAEYFRIPRETAMAGMLKATPDPGALTVHNIEESGSEIVFANAFAANDPDSNRLVLDTLFQRYKDYTRFVIINNRADRQTRILQLIDIIKGIEAEHFYMIGTGTEIFKGLLKKKKIDTSVFSDYSSMQSCEIFRDIGKRCKKNALAIGIGNIGGVGHDVVEYCETQKKGG